MPEWYLAGNKSTRACLSDVTLLLNSVEQGEPTAAERLLVLVYEELRRLAASKMSHESSDQTLQPTALVHEAWLRLVGNNRTSFQNRAHFFSAAAEAMRRILIDRARRKLSVRHGGEYERISADQLDLAAPDADQELLVVDEVLDKFTQQHPVKAEVVKLRFFAGMTHDEIAQVLGMSEATARNYWTFARAWILNEINQS
jgi:RNA polymerase sigma factor (TIGR02999 family)